MTNNRCIINNMKQVWSLRPRCFTSPPLRLQVRNLRALQGAGGGGLRRAAARQGERDAPPLGRHQQQDRPGQVSHEGTHTHGYKVVLVMTTKVLVIGVI